MKDDPDEFHTWLANNPPPILADLLDRYGKWTDIPEPVLEDHDRRWNEWNGKRIARILGHTPEGDTARKNRPAKAKP